jgi:hypothetical protein
VYQPEEVHITCSVQEAAPMSKHQKRWELLLVFMVAVSAESGLALSPDPQLLSMVPPNVRVMAGVCPPNQSKSNNILLFINTENEIDLNDFLAVFGVDDAKRWHEVMVLGEEGDAGKLTEHSVLASGHFNSGLIFNSAIRNGATTVRYRGIAVLVLQPFARDPADLITTRWLTILDSKLAIFGSIAMVQEELDRHLAGASPDSTLTERLSHLRQADGSWSAIKHFVSEERVNLALGLLDPQLEKLVRSGDEFVLGVHLGRHIEIEYQSFKPIQPSHSIASPSPVSPGSETFLSRPNAEPEHESGSWHVVVTTTQKKYDSWMSTIVAEAKVRHQ